MNRPRLSVLLWPVWLAGLVLVVVLLPALSADAQTPSDFAVPSGRFFTQTRGNAPPEYGFMISDDSSSQFWAAFQKYGGVPVLGYPVSHRFNFNGSLVQAMQKVVFRWDAAANSTTFMNVFDELAQAGRDPWLLANYQIPPAQDWSADAARSYPEIVAAHLALLDLNPSIRATYLAVQYPTELYGLPMGAGDFPNVFVIRAQRAAFQYWKTDTPWAKAGDVTVANGGDVIKASGLFPDYAITPATLAGQLWQAPTATPTTTGSPTQTPTVTQSPTLTPTPTQTQTPAPTATPTNTPTPAQSGTIFFDTFEAIVQGVDYRRSLTGGSGTVNAFAQYAVVTLRVRNNGPEPNALLPEDLAFRDPAGRVGSIAGAEVQHAAQDQYGRPGLYTIIQPTFYTEVVIVWDIQIESQNGGVVPHYPYNIPDHPAFLEAVPINHPIQFAHWQITVKGAEWRQSLQTNPGCVIANGVYITVFGRVTNLGASSNAIQVGDIRIQGGYGRMWDLAGYLQQDAAQALFQRPGIGSTVAAGASVDMVFVFDTAAEVRSALGGHTARFTPLLQPRSQATDLGVIPQASNVPPCSATATRTPTATPATVTSTPTIINNPTSTPTQTPTATGTPQGTWRSQSYPGGTTLRGISMLSSTDGFAVGDSGVIIRGGANSWSSQSSPVTSLLRDVEARSGSFAIAVGDQGVGLVWNGSNWTDQLAGTTPDLLAVSLVPGSTSDGWVAGSNGAVYRWNGSGFNSALVLPGLSTSIRVRNVHTVSSSEAYAVTGDGDNGIYRWNGSTWIKLYTGSASLNAVYVVGSTGYAVGDGGIIIQYNGTSWNQIGSPTGNTLNAIAMISATEGWAVGDGGVILRLLNGTWSNYTSSTSAALRSVSIVSSSEAWAAGDAVLLRYTVP